MDDEATQPATQQVLDPRRLGRNNSGLTDVDIADVLCILHPASSAALDIVEETAKNKSFYVLSRDPFQAFDGDTDINEQQTVYIEKSGTALSHDLALRMSAPLLRPALGFVFGRNGGLSDIVFSKDAGRRISNQHFRIYLNDEGVLMIEDMSTNGTMVDDTFLKSKDPSGKMPRNRMLNSGTVITVSSGADTIKFIVRFPSRDGNAEQYRVNFRNFVKRCVQDESKRAAIHKLGNPADKHWGGGDMYNFIGQIGQGAFATVYQIATKMEGKLYAAKELEKKKFIKNGQLDKKIDNEMQIMKGLEHPNIVKFIDFHDHGDYLYIIMEFVPHGDLQGHLRNLKGPLSEPQAKTIARQILDALAYLHRQNITHRDIKPDNILIMQEDPFVVKLSDFGLSKVVQDNGTFLKTFCGTLLYCAPEVFPDYDPPGTKQGTKRRRGPSQRFHSYNSSVDIWSFAAVLWFSLCKEPPFEGIADNTGKAMYTNIMSTKLDPTPLRSYNVSNEGIDLLLKMLQTDPARRLTEQECFRHPWLFNGTVLPDDNGLDSIVEEDEGCSEEAGEQLSQLSIREVEAEEDELDEVAESDVDLDDEDLEFFAGHRSKRIRSDHLFPRNQMRDHSDSSADVSFQSEHQPAQASLVGESFAPIPTPVVRNRLFGEIKPSVLGASTSILQTHVNEALSGQGSVVAELPEDPQAQIQKRVEKILQSSPRRPGPGQLDGGVPSSPSLLGAESMVRELNMESPHSYTSGTHSPNEPATPKTPDVPQHSSLSKSSQISEPTPKARVPTFRRQISVPKTPSYYYDPYDPSTHTLEYASKVSGIDFVAEAQATKEQQKEYPDTIRFSAELGQQRSHDEESARSVASTTSATDIKPPPRRLGKLTSTADSINPNLVMSVDQPRTSFGRLAENTLVWENKMDSRIPKKAFTIWWESDVAGEVESYAEEGKDWSNLEGLHVGIFTSASGGIYVNGIKLQTKDPQGRFCYGRLHTGDIVQVYEKLNECLRFKCVFFYGAGKEPRAAGTLFKIETAKVQS
jgi:serine/threonine protein kinase